MCKPHPIQHLTQTMHSVYNRCTFEYNGKRYYGRGEPLKGIYKALYKYNYKWSIYTENNRFLFSFGAPDATTPLTRRNLKKYMIEFFNTRS